MGTWGFSILQDDVARDVYGEYIERFNAGESHDTILDGLTVGNAEMVEDTDDGPVFWLAVARAQWECGALSPVVLKRVEDIVQRGEGLDRWEESGTKSLERRRKVLATFLGKLRSPNPRPKKPRKGVRRKPIFAAGDCLAIRLSDGDFGAAVVLDCPPEIERPGADTYGRNLVGMLRYKSPEKPSMEVFERRQWLRLTHHSWNNKLSVYGTMSRGFRSVKHRFEVVGKTQIRPDDPKETNSFAGWDLFPEQMVHQARWEVGEAIRE